MHIEESIPRKKSQQTVRVKGGWFSDIFKVVKLAYHHPEEFTPLDIQSSIEMKTLQQVHNWYIGRVKRALVK